MDMSMPDQSGVDALAAIKAREPDLPVLILSGYPEAHYATTLLRQGASGYLNKECDPDEIVKAIRTVARGRKYITPAVAELLADTLGASADKLPHELLSEREFQVFLRLAKGETIGHMADSMSLSVKTVSTYRTRVMEKMKPRLQQRPDLLRAEERPDPVAGGMAAGRGPVLSARRIHSSAQKASSSSSSADLSNTRSAPSCRQRRRMSARGVVGQHHPLRAGLQRAGRGAAPPAPCRTSGRCR
jgi:FixJ family two-component response regulator